MLFIDPYTASLSPTTQPLNTEGASHAGDYLFLRFVLFVQVVTVAEGGQRMGGGRPTVKIGAMESAVATTHIGLDHMRAARGEVAKELKKKEGRGGAAGISGGVAG